MERLWIQNNEADRKTMLIQASENHKGMVLPAIDEFYTLIQKAQEEAKRIGLTEADIDSVIKEVRQEKRK